MQSPQPTRREFLRTAVGGAAALAAPFIPSGCADMLADIACSSGKVDCAALDDSLATTGSARISVLADIREIVAPFRESGAIGAESLVFLKAATYDPVRKGVYVYAHEAIPVPDEGSYTGKFHLIFEPLATSPYSRQLVASSDSDQWNGLGYAEHIANTTTHIVLGGHAMVSKETGDIRAPLYFNNPVHLQGDQQAVYSLTQLGGPTWWMRHHGVTGDGDMILINESLVVRPSATGETSLTGAAFSSSDDLWLLGTDGTGPFPAVEDAHLVQAYPGAPITSPPPHPETVNIYESLERDDVLDAIKTTFPDHANLGVAMLGVTQGGSLLFTLRPLETAGLQPTDPAALAAGIIAVDPDSLQVRQLVTLANLAPLFGIPTDAHEVVKMAIEGDLERSDLDEIRFELRFRTSIFMESGRYLLPGGLHRLFMLECAG